MTMVGVKVGMTRVGVKRCKSRNREAFWLKREATGVDFPVACRVLALACKIQAATMPGFATPVTCILGSRPKVKRLPAAG
jgi:hypothetical protein